MVRYAFHEKAKTALVNQILWSNKNNFWNHLKWLGGYLKIQIKQTEHTLPKLLLHQFYNHRIH